MPVTITRWRRPVLVACVCAVFGFHTAFAQVETIGTYYRPDQAFPQFNAFWAEGQVAPGEEAAGDQAGHLKPAKAEKAKPAARVAPAATRPARDNADEQDSELGGSLHVFLRNAGPSAVKVNDAFLSGLSLNDSLAFSGQRKVKKFASIYFAKLTPGQLKSLIADGEPVWWKVDPLEIAPGATAEVIVRLRAKPRWAAVPVALRVGSQTVTASVPVTDPAPRLESIGFAPNLRDVYLYFRHPTNATPTRITLDGQDITANCRISHDANLAVTPVITRLAAPLTAGSFHIFGGKYADASSVMSGLRAWADEFVYGVFGGKPGNKKDAAVGRQYIGDLTSHNLNLQMPQIGSRALQDFFKDPQGRKYMAARGFRFVLSDPGKFGIKDPYALYVHDEPDCGDFKAEGLPDNKKVGVLARWCISRAGEFRQAAPTVMQMLNLNMTYQPHNWHIYGQIPDIFTVDPYYQVRQKSAYYDHPERIPLYRKATYIYMVSSIAHSASAPHPMHVILYANQQNDKKDKTRTFRFPTPPEKRIEVYYALAAGAKSLSYWWYTPGGAANGLGAASLPRPDAEAQALWREIGLLGAELRTAGPVLLTACPTEVPVEAPDNIWVRFLARGDDTLVMLVVNEQYANTKEGTDLTPVKNAAVAVTLPGWMKPAQAFEITPAGTNPVAAKVDHSRLRVQLGDFDVTRMVVITADPKLRGRLQGYYEAQLAANTAALLKQGR